MKLTTLKALKKADLLEYVIKVEQQLEEKVSLEKELIGKYVACIVFGLVSGFLIR